MVEALAAGPRGQPERLLGQLEHLAEVAAVEYRVPDEVDLLDLRLAALVNIEGDLPLPGVDGEELRPDVGLQVALLPQHLLDGRLDAPQDGEIDRLAAPQLEL